MLLADLNNTCFTAYKRVSVFVYLFIYCISLGVRHVEKSLEETFLVNAVCTL